MSQLPVDMKRDLCIYMKRDLCIYTDSYTDIDERYRSTWRIPLCWLDSAVWVYGLYIWKEIQVYKQTLMYIERKYRLTRHTHFSPLHFCVWVCGLWNEVYMKQLCTSLFICVGLFSYMYRSRFIYIGLFSIRISLIIHMYRSLFIYVGLVSYIWKETYICTQSQMYIEMRGIVSHDKYLCFDSFFPLLWESMAYIFERRLIYIHRHIYK